MKFPINCRRTSTGTYRRTVIWGLMAAIFALSAPLAGQVSQPPSQAASEETFDAPVRKISVDLGRSPYFPDDNIRNTLSCYYFPGLMVKQYDQGEVGREWLAIHRFRGKPPECRLSHNPGEQVMEPSEWGGYFRGRKGDLLFFDGGECQQGACQFGVYDLITGKWIFQDDEAYKPENEPPWDRMRVLSTKAGTVIRYLRVSYAECDLHSEGKSCWESVQAKLGLKRDTIPHCDGYDPEALAYLTEDPNAPVLSMIAYPVEVLLAAHPVVKSLAGPVRCWPAN